MVELEDAIQAVREQLVKAQLAKERTVAGQVLSFEVGRVEIELGAEVKEVAGGSGGVKLWVVTINAKGERSAQATHKVKIELIPVDRHGNPLKVASHTSGPTPE